VDQIVAADMRAAEGSPAVDLASPDAKAPPADVGAPADSQAPADASTPPDSALPPDAAAAPDAKVAPDSAPATPDSAPATPDSAAVTLDKGKPPASCGNGQVDPGEQCDGSVSKKVTCTSLGFMGGTVACDSYCKYDTAKCEKCGDGKIHSGEQCDKTNLNGKTCKDLGFTGGILGCAVTCALSSDQCTSKGCTSAAVAGGSYKVTTSGSTYPTANGSPSMALDGQGKVHLLFRKDLTYVTDLSGSWKSTKLKSGTTADCHALAVDSAGKVHVAYRDSAKVLWTLSNAGGSWAAQLLDKGVGCGFSVAAAGPGDVGVAYTVTGASGDLVRHASLSKGKWTKAPVTAGAKAISNLVRDGKGGTYLAVSFPGLVRVIKKQPTGWKILASYAGNFPDPGAATLDSKGALHLIISAGSRQYVTNRSGAWVSTPLVVNVYTAAIAVDAAGHAYLAGTAPGTNKAFNCMSRVGVYGYAFDYWGTCKAQAPAIYTNASGSWAASPTMLVESDDELHDWDMACEKTWTFYSTTIISQMKVHGARLHLAYGRRTTRNHYMYSQYCANYSYSDYTTEDAHKVRCLK